MLVEIKKKNQNVGGMQIINFSGGLLSEWMAVPAFLGAPVPKMVLTSVLCEARACKWRIHPLRLCVHCCKNKSSSNKVMQRSISG